MKNFRIKLIIICIVIFSIVPVYAKSIKQNNNESGSKAEYEIRKMLKNEGSDDKTIDKLILKLKNGELWDSFKPEYKKIKPQIDTPNYKKTVYPDGSMRIVGSITNGISLFKSEDLHYENDVQIYHNTIVINAYFTMNYIRDTISGLARIRYQSEPVITIWDIGGNGQAYDVHYDYNKDWKNPSCAWVSFYPAGSALLGEQCWLRGYCNGNGHWIDYEY